MILLMRRSVSSGEHHGSSKILNRILSRIIIPYSAINRKANSTLENSMLKPLTSSLSASARSKGLRFVSARIIIVAGMMSVNVIISSKWSGNPHQKSVNRVKFMVGISRIGCISPIVETLFGPNRRWLMPMYCRSIRVTKAIDNRIVIIIVNNSEHCPYMIPGSVDSVVVELMRPGIASILIPSDGIVHLWITSADVTDIRIGTWVGKITRLSQSKSRKSCDSHSFMIGGVGSPSSVYRAFIDMPAIDRSTPSGEIVQRNSSHLWSNIREFLEVNRVPVSREAFESLTPVSPPIVNSKRNPSTHNMAGVILMCVPYSVANHLKIFTPVGIPMIIVAAVKMGSPPPEVSKKVVPKLRSVKSMVIPPAKTGSEIISRDKKHVVIKLILPAIDEMPARCREKITRSTLWLGCPSQVDSGGIKAGGSNQNPRLFSRGKDISVAPTIIGISQFPNPLSSIGITIKKIMYSEISPFTLNVHGEDRIIRIRADREIPSIPPITPNKMYSVPIFL
ncbi:hypothetical protein T09_658 [Trichinella sp. T9]|nr:hypothetical protein T09_658 [Trichinella sp. T9]